MVKLLILKWETLILCQWREHPGIRGRNTSDTRRGVEVGVHGCINKLCFPESSLEPFS